MDRVRSIFSRPFAQFILLMGAAFFIYFIASSPRGEIWDFEIQGQYAYLANGIDGIKIVSLADPENLEQKGFFRCGSPFLTQAGQRYNFLNCLRSTRSIFIQDSQLFVTARRSGLWMFDISSDPSKPVKEAQLVLPGIAQDVTVVGNYAYVAAGNEGVRVVQILKQEDLEKDEQDKGQKNRLLDLEESAIEGNATRIFYDDSALYWLDNRKTLHFSSIDQKDKPEELGDVKNKYDIFDIAFRGQLAFLAAGEEGLIICDKHDLPAFPKISGVNPGGETRSVFLSGDYAYLAVEGKGLVIVDITDISKPRIVQKPFEVNGNPSKIIQQGSLTYLSTRSDGFYAFDSNILIRSELLGESGAQMTAMGVVKSGEFLYVASGERGLRVLNATNPKNVNEVAFLDTAGRADGVAVGGDIAYVADRNNGLVIIDVTNRSGMLPLVNQIPSEDARDVAWDGDYVYLADYVEGLKIVNVTNPLSASLVKTMDQNPGNPMHPLSVTVLGDYVYLASGDQGVRIVNVYDKNIPTQVQQIQVPGKSDARNITVMAYNPQVVGQDHYQADPRDPTSRIYAYVANGVFGLQVLDVTNPTQNIPVLLNLNDQVKSLPGIAMDVAFSGNRAYLAYDGGDVYILDITEPTNPQFVGAVNLQGVENRAVGLDVDGSTVYLATHTHGVSIIDASNTTASETIGRYDAPASVKNMAIRGNYAYTVDGSRGMWIFDVSDSKHPQEIHFVPISEASGVDIMGNFAFVAAGNSGLQVVDITNKQAATVIGGVDTPGFANAIQVALRPGVFPPVFLAYIADGDNGLVVVDVTNPGSPQRVGGLNQIGPATRLAYDGKSYVFVTASQTGLVAVNVIDPVNPVRMDIKRVAPDTRGVAIIKDLYAYTAAGTAGMPIVDVSYPLYMVPVGSTVPSDGQWIENVSIPITSYLAVTQTISNTLSISDTNTISSTLPLSSTIGLNPSYAFLAERTRGVRILETTDPVFPQPRGGWVAPTDPEAPGEAEIVPDIVQVIPEWYPPVDDEKPGAFTLYVADATHGFSIVKGTKETAIFPLDVFETSGLPTLNALSAYVRAKRQGDPNPSEKTSMAIRQLLLDMVLFGVVGFLLWLGFLALFVLPADRFIDWENLYNRFIYYLFGRHGPMIRARDGRVNAAPGELERPGPGVLLADASSAVVLEKRNLAGGRQKNIPLARVASSGIFYLGNRTYLSVPRFDEIMHGEMADLRPQFRFASDVKGYTRDGIEVTTSVFTVFTLGEYPDVVKVAYIPPKDDEIESKKAQPYQPELKDLKVISIKRVNNGSWTVNKITDELDEDDKREIHQYVLLNPNLHAFTEFEDDQIRQVNPGKSPYVVDPVRIFQAVYAQAEDQPEQIRLEWDDLPTMVAIERFRNILAGENYDHLYEPMHVSDYPISDMKAHISHWVRNQGVLSYQFIRRVDNRVLVEGQEFHTSDLLASDIQALGSPKILRSRGIKVKVAGFGELYPTNENVRKQFFDYWQAQREKDADFILSNFELRVRRQSNEWRIQAQQEILNELNNILDAKPYANEALAMHVLQALEGAATDPETSALLPGETVDILRNLRNWLLHM